MKKLSHSVNSVNTFNPASTLPLLLLVLTTLVFTGCERKTTTPVATPTASPSSLSADPAIGAATIGLWQTAARQLQDCGDGSQTLRNQIGALLADPTEQSLADARQAWHQTHNRLLAFSVFFAIADSAPGLFGELTAHRYHLDGQPIQPGFIDYFDVYQQSGIVNDMAMTLSAEALRNQHGITDNTDISIGFHAMEYLLWGERGQRPVEDFAPITTLTAEQEQMDLRTVDLSNNRRRIYLQLLAELLVDDCAKLHQHWLDQNRELYQNYHGLQTGSQLQLWQTALTHVVTELAQTLDGLNGDDKSGGAGNSATTDPDLEIPGVHNQFAGLEPQAIASILAGMTSLLYGSDAAQTEASEPGLAQWILPGLPPLPTDPEPNDQSQQPDSPAQLSTLAQALSETLTSLEAESSWPPSAASQQKLSVLLQTLNLGLKLSGQDADAPPQEDSSPDK